MTQIILIHGINNEKNSKRNIEKTWSESLRLGMQFAGGSFPNDLKFHAAFYGDILKSQTDIWNKKNSENGNFSAEALPKYFAEIGIHDLYREYQHAFGISDEALINYMNPEDSLGNVFVEGAGIHKGWLKAIVRALEDVVPTKGKFLARIFLKQAAAYLQKPMLKEEIDSLVYEQVFEKLDPCTNTIVIAHSLGTIVGYSILRALGKDFPVSLFMTAGSPLGIDIVKKRLGPPLIRPLGVKKWTNIADPDDFVALHKRLNTKSFGTSKITNISNLDNGYEDPHNILKYLSHARVAKHVLRALT